MLNAIQNWFITRRRLVFLLHLVQKMRIKTKIKIQNKINELVDICHGYNKQNSGESNFSIRTCSTTIEHSCEHWLERACREKSNILFSKNKMSSYYFYSYSCEHHSRNKHMVNVCVSVLLVFATSYYYHCYHFKIEFFLYTYT